MRIVSPIKTFGNSMYPLLHNGDVVFFKKKKFSKIKVNDIICISINNKAIVHRVIYRKSKFLITKGDNSFLSDGKIISKNYIGNIVKVKRGKTDLGINDLYLFQSTIYLREITKVKRSFEKKGVEMVFLKGLPLYLLYDSNHPKRIYADCDILVPERDYVKTKKILQTAGYVQINNDLLGNHKRTSKKFPETSFIKIFNDLPVIFDIHIEPVFLMSQISNLNLLYPKKLTRQMTEKFLKERVSVKIMGESFYLLSPENLFIYLCLHLFHHNFKGPFRFDLICLVINSGKINFDLAIDMIQKFKLDSFIYPSVCLLEKFYEINFPQGFKNGFVNINRKKHEESIKGIDIFNDKGRIGEGSERFKRLLVSSPAPFYLKIFVFFDPQVIAGIWFVFLKKIKTRFSLLFFSI